VGESRSSNRSIPTSLTPEALQEHVEADQILTHGHPNDEALAVIPCTRGD
jgi:hypothetical protein